jgi:hypothetical protein
MGLGTLALVANSAPFSTVKAEGSFNITMTINLADYAAGGFAADALIKAISGVGTRITILRVKQISHCDGYKIWYVRSTGKLAVYQGAAGLSPDSEVGAGAVVITGAEFEVDFI